MKFWRKLFRTSKKRLTWDEYGLALAKAVSLRAACTRRQVGAVIMDKDHRVISAGYNGTPPGKVNCSDGGCPRGQLSYTECPAYGAYTNCKGRHAEQNALLWADTSRLQGSTVYVTDKPCEGCTRMLKGMPVVRVVWPEGEWNNAH